MLTRLTHFVNLAVFAPAGAGKTTSLAMPILFDWPRAAVVLDVKGELFQATAAYRWRAFGHTIIRLDPFEVFGPGDTYNVLGGVRYDSPHFLPDIRALAEAQVVSSPHAHDAQHWDESARLWLEAMLAFTVWDSQPADRNLDTLRTIFTAADLFMEAVGRLCRAPHETLRRLGNQILFYQDRELHSVRTTCNRQIAYLDTPQIANFVRRSSFDPQALCDPDGRTTIYIIIPPEYLRSENRLLRVIVGSLLRGVVRGGLDPRRQVLFLLDEFPALGRQEVILDALCQYRAYGARLVLIAQALGQWQLCFPEGQVQTALANCDQLFFGVRDYQTAEAVSQRLGQATVPVTTWQESCSRSASVAFGDRQQEQISTSWSNSAAETGRPLLTPGEVMQLGTRRGILFAQNMPPILLRLCRWYEDPAFRGQGCERLGAGMVAGCLLLLLLALLVAGTVTERILVPPSPAAPEQPAPGGTPPRWPSVGL